MKEGFVLAILSAALFVPNVVWAKPAVVVKQETQKNKCADLPEIVLFKNHDQNPDEGVWRTNDSFSYVGDDWQDTISSWDVVRGTWELCVDANFQNCKIATVGRYDVRDTPGWGAFNDDKISSFRAISACGTENSR